MALTLGYTVVQNGKNPPKIRSKNIEKFTCHTICLQQFDDDPMTGNGSHVNLLKLSYKNSWNQGKLFLAGFSHLELLWARACCMYLKASKNPCTYAVVRRHKCVQVSYILKLCQNKKDQTFVGMLVFYMSFFAAGSWLKFKKRHTKSEHPNKCLALLVLSGLLQVCHSS